MTRQPEQKAEEIIESRLEKVGWKHIDNTQSSEYYDDKVQFPGGLEADYVLYVYNEPVGIIEAKKPKIDPMKHRHQARNYAKAIGNEYGNNYAVPYLFASNGEKIAIEDVRSMARTPRYIESFYSPSEIQRRSSLSPEGSMDYLRGHGWEDIDEELWINQQEGLEKVKESILNRDDKILVTMATGSGKTRLAMALCYLLLESGRISRVLFVPDTSELRRDTLQDFKKYEPINSEKLSDKYPVGDFDEHKQEDKNLSVVVDTIQKVKTKFRNRDDHNSGEFDLIIADECHRGVNNKEGYAEVLNFYDAIEIGLTATPHRDTIERYNENWVYSYDYEQALEDGKVVPFSPYIIKTDVTMNGYTDPDTGEHYYPREIGRKIDIEQTNKIIAKELSERVDLEDELTLVFAQSTDHADNIERDFTEVFEEETDVDSPKELVTVITGEQRHAETQLQEFKKQDRNPRVAVTVDMVTTGVDIKPLENLVFIRSVKSPILFNQMMGRGTRNIPQKDMFTVFDCVGVFDHHKDGMFSTDNMEIQVDRSSNSSSGQDTTGRTEQELVRIAKKDADRLVKAEEGYPIKTQGQVQIVDEEEYLRQVATTIGARKEKIVESVDSCTSMKEANESIESILRQESEFFDSSYILKATDDHSSLFEFCNEVINKQYSLREKAQEAEKNVVSKYNIDDEERKWTKAMVKKSVNSSDSIELSDLLSKPFSNFGGYDEAKRVFGEERLKAVLESYNKNFVSLSS